MTRRPTIHEDGVPTYFVQLHAFTSRGPATTEGLTPTRTHFSSLFFRRRHGVSPRYFREATCACVNFPTNRAYNSNNSDVGRSCDGSHLQ
jgi:hypothetical protein